MAGDAADEDMSWLESSQMQELRQKYESGEWSQGKVIRENASLHI